MGIKRYILPLQAALNTFRQKVLSSGRESFYPGFEEIAHIWKPADGLTPIIARWHMTEWCNYSCPYCYQEHDRKRIIRQENDGVFTAYAFDNFPVGVWVDAFRRLAEKYLVTLTITGGEPFLDAKNMVVFLGAMVKEKNLVNIRVDTNASWDPERYRGIDKDKIYLMCTFHPSRSSVRDFIGRIEKLVTAGFQVAMVNFVMAPGQMKDFTELRKSFEKIRVPLSANPLIGEPKLSEEESAYLKSVSNEFDLAYKGQLISPKGKQCFYPMVSYEIDMTGRMITGCHPDQSGDFIAGRYPRLCQAPVVCNAEYCTCLDKYSFLEGCKRNISLNPLIEFAKEIPRDNTSRAPS
jgi:organic radical activating enzyme